MLSVHCDPLLHELTPQVKNLNIDSGSHFSLKKCPYKSLVVGIWWPLQHLQVNCVFLLLHCYNNINHLCKKNFQLTMNIVINLVLNWELVKNWLSSSLLPRWVLWTSGWGRFPTPRCWSTSCRSTGASAPPSCGRCCSLCAATRWCVTPSETPGAWPSTGRSATRSPGSAHCR